MPKPILKIILSSKQKQELKNLGVLLLYLYGSYATGYYNDESDVDIGVLVTKKEAEMHQKSLNKELRVIGKVDDVISTYLPTRSGDYFIDHDIKIINHLTPLLKMRILTDGVLFYKRTDFDRVQFQLQTVREYEDWQHLVKIKYYYLNKRIQLNKLGEPVPLLIHKG
jgi:predicted nucleotidyltransferase